MIASCSSRPARACSWGTLRRRETLVLDSEMAATAVLRMHRDKRFEEVFAAGGPAVPLAL